MSTLRISNIEAKSVPASATIDEKVKITNSSGDPLVFIDGKTSGITTVGINTTDPNITFDANSNVVVTGIITATKFSGQFEPTSVGIADSIFHTGDDNTSIRFPAADTITAETGGSERIRIDSNGDMALGGAPITSGYKSFTIHEPGTDSGSHVRFNMTNGNTGNTASDGFSITVNASTKNIHYIQREAADMAFQNTGGRRFTIKSDGKIGIGDFSSINPAALMHVSGSYAAPTGGFGSSVYSLISNSGAANNSCGLSINAGNNGVSFIQFGDTDDANVGTIEYHHSDNSMVFDTSAGERARITSGGDVGIGVTNPNAKLHLASGSSSAVGDSTNPAFQIGSTGNYRFGAYTTNEGAIIANKNGDDGIIFHTKTGTGAGSFGEGCRITSAGNLAFTSGKGIDFSATSDASGMSNELLDDYEEGSWTPTFAALNNASHATVHYATYTKIGRQVTIRISFTISSSVSDTSGLGFNLPYTPSSTERVVMATISNRSGTNKAPFAMVNSNETQYMYAKTLEGYSFQQYNYFSGNYVVCTGTYESA
jgi:hypothetical protein